MVGGMATSTQPARHIARENLAQAATQIAALRRTVNQENDIGRLVRDLVGKVGGLDALESLHRDPLPDEPFLTGAVGNHNPVFAAESIAVFDERATAHLDIEFRTIGRRLFARALLNEPTLIRKSSSPVRFAAGLAHAVLAANDRIGGASRQWRSSDIAAWFGTSSAGDPARRLVAAARFERTMTEDDPWRRIRDDGLRMPSPDLLHSETRDRLVVERERLLVAIEQHEASRAGRRPTVSLGDGCFSRRGSLAHVGVVAKGRALTGRTMLLLGFTPLVPNSDLDIFVLDLDDARFLADRLSAVLAAPTPNHNGIGHFDDIDNDVCRDYGRFSDQYGR